MSTERELITEALRIYLAAGVGRERALQMTTAHLEDWRSGRSSRDPVQFAQHFAQLRSVVVGPPVQATYVRHEPIALPAAPEDEAS